MMHSLTFLYSKPNASVLSYTRQRRIFPDTENHLLRAAFRETSGLVRCFVVRNTLSVLLRFIARRIIITLVFNQVNECFGFQTRRHLRGLMERSFTAKKVRIEITRYGYESTRESCHLKNVNQDKYFGH